MTLTSLHQTPCARGAGAERLRGCKYRCRLVTIPPSRLRRATSLYTREAFFTTSFCVAQSAFQIFTYTVEIIVNLIVGYTENAYTVCFEICIPPGVMFLPVFFKMLGAVQFNYHFDFRRIKINNIVSENFLTGKPNRMLPQKVIPKMPLLFGHILPQLSCIRHQRRIMLSIHLCSLHQAPLCKGSWHASA